MRTNSSLDTNRPVDAYIVNTDPCLSIVVEQTTTRVSVSEAGADQGYGLAG